MTVSRSITQTPCPVTSSRRTLFSFVSLWVTRSARSPAAASEARLIASGSCPSTNVISRATPAARPRTSRATASRKRISLHGVSWKCGIVSARRGGGRSERRR